MGKNLLTDLNSYALGSIHKKRMWGYSWTETAKSNKIHKNAN